MRPACTPPAPRLLRTCTLLAPRPRLALPCPHLPCARPAPQRRSTSHPAAPLPRPQPCITFRCCPRHPCMQPHPSLEGSPRLKRGALGPAWCGVAHVGVPVGVWGCCDALRAHGQTRGFAGGCCVIAEILQRWGGGEWKDLFFFLLRLQHGAGAGSGAGLCAVTPLWGLLLVSSVGLPPRTHSCAYILPSLRASFLLSLHPSLHPPLHPSIHHPSILLLPEVSDGDERQLLGASSHSAVQSHIPTARPQMAAGPHRHRAAGARGWMEGAAPGSVPSRGAGTGLEGRSCCQHRACPTRQPSKWGHRQPQSPPASLLSSGRVQSSG